MHASSLNGLHRNVQELFGDVFFHSSVVLGPPGTKIRIADLACGTGLVNPINMPCFLSNGRVEYGFQSSQTSYSFKARSAIRIFVPGGPRTTDE